jgi:16S rRNA (cytosine1402-N4)-methyltransferase
MTQAPRAPHEPVLLREVVERLVTDADGRYLDCTLGMGGHTAALLRALSPRGKVLALDVDPEALVIAGHRLASYAEALTLVRANFKNAGDVAASRGFSPLNGVLMDLGFSSYQVAKGTRGLSFSEESPLDMRLDPSEALTAADIVNQWTEEELERIFRDCGERAARRIARAIVRERQASPLKTTRQLAALAVRHGFRGRLHPATRVFLALRIAVNHELENLAAALEGLKGQLAPRGRLAVISFHSLEDRIVKLAFRRWTQEGGWRLVTPKPLSPTTDEVLENPRARSAKLRVIERLPG